jgi:hypothetical protein
MGKWIGLAVLLLFLVGAFAEPAYRMHKISEETKIIMAKQENNEAQKNNTEDKKDD